MDFDHTYRKERLFKYVAKRYGRKIVAIFVFLVIISICAATIFAIPPKSYPAREILTIKQGTYLSQAADTLESHGIIKSSFLFKVFVVAISGHRQVQAGDYLFEKPQSALRIAYRMVYGEQDLPKIKVTIFEGMTVKDIGNVIKRNVPKFDLQSFLTLAAPYEGYLFPDTYYFYENTKPADVVDSLKETFATKVKTKLLDIQAFGKPLSDVIIMASIVEREANKDEDRRIIAGILWRRLEIGMPLQVDPPFQYILGKGSAQLTLTDLAVDSPYNLYKHVGLPPTPISNPGLGSIIATLNPTKTNYLYFLSDSKGVMHYAETHEGHLANKAKYIK